MPRRARLPLFRARALLLLCAGLLVRPLPALAQQEPFEVRALHGTGRSVAAELADFDGDGRTDLLEIAFLGLPPSETRLLRVHLQREGTGIPEAPSFEVPLPAGSAAYDLADVLEAPGIELLLLRPEGVLVLSLASKDAPQRELRIGGGSTLAAEDERGLERLPLAFGGFGAEPCLIVPRFGEIVALSPTGELRGIFDAGARANYFVTPRPGPLVAESDIQLFLDVPRLSVGDVDGDGRTDVVTSTRLDVRVFLQREDGSFARAPDRRLPLARVSERDHLRGSGQVRVDAADFDGDRRLDLLISQVRGGLLDATAETTLHRNRNGSWDLARPDRVFRETEAWSVDELRDLDGDGRPELVRAWIPMNLIEVVEALATRSFDLHVSVHRFDPEQGFGAKPWLERKLDVSFDFETGRPAGFLPSAAADLNGDGLPELIESGSGDRIEIYLGARERPFDERGAVQAIESSGRVRFGDLDGDGLTDLLLYDPKRPGAPLTLARNRGILPGTPAAFERRTGAAP